MRKRIFFCYFIVCLIALPVFAEVGAGYYFRFNNFKLSIDFNELEAMVKTWRKIPDYETFVMKYKQRNLLVIDGNWDVYSFPYCNFSTHHDYYSFDLIDNEKIIITGIDGSYELTQEQYDEFISFVTK